MILRPRLLVALSAVSMVAALVVAGLIARSRPSVAGLVELCVVPALLIIDAFVMSSIAAFSADDGEDDDGGIDRPGVDQPERPSGGIEVDWDRFEADFRDYSERHERVHAEPASVRDAMAASGSNWLEPRAKFGGSSSEELLKPGNQAQRGY